MRGVQFGRLETPMPENFEEVYELWSERKISRIEAIKRSGMTKATFYRKVRKIRESRENSKNVE